MKLPKTISECMKQIRNLRLKSLKMQRMGATEEELRQRGEKLLRLVLHQRYLIDLQKNHSVSIRLTGHQYVNIKEKAAKRNESLSEYIRNQLVAHGVI